MSLVDYEVVGPVARIMLNRPPVNALNADLIGDIASALAHAQDPAVRAVVIHGQPHFAAGADIARFVPALESPGEEVQASGVADLAMTMELMEKPVIAAVTGFALGGGLELAMGADFRYLSEGARVGQPEILLGLIPGAGGTQRLPRLIGYQAAKRLILSGRHVTAAEALELGLADEVLPEDDLLARALDDAAKWATGPTIAYGAAKRAMIGGVRSPLDEGLVGERIEFNKLFTTVDARSGIEAFLAKDRAEFIGR